MNSVRGYHEGEVFGDTGWHVSWNNKRRRHVVGTVYDGAPLTIRGSVYMDYARVYLIDPLGRQDSTPFGARALGFPPPPGPTGRRNCFSPGRC